MKEENKQYDQDEPMLLWGAGILTGLVIAGMISEIKILGFVQALREWDTFLAGALALVGAVWTVRKIGVQIKQQDLLLEETQRYERIRQLEKIVLDKEKLLVEIVRTSIRPSDKLINHLMEDLSHSAGPGEYNYTINELEKRIEVFRDPPLPTRRYVFFGNPFQQLKTVISLQGVEKAKELVWEDDVYEIKHILRTFSSTYAHLFYLLREMINEGYSLSAAKAVLGSSYDAVELLYSVDIVERNLLDWTKLISSLGMSENRQLRIDVTSIFHNELISQGLMSSDVESSDIDCSILQEAATRDYVFYAWVKTEPTTQFIRKQGSWKVNE